MVGHSPYKVHIGRAAAATVTPYQRKPDHWRKVGPLPVCQRRICHGGGSDGPGCLRCTRLLRALRRPQLSYEPEDGLAALGCGAHARRHLRGGSRDLLKRSLPPIVRRLADEVWMSRSVPCFQARPRHPRRRSLPRRKGRQPLPWTRSAGGCRTNVMKRRPTSVTASWCHRITDTHQGGSLTMLHAGLDRSRRRHDVHVVDEGAARRWRSARRHLTLEGLGA